jgi:hypothetical protein
MLQKMAQAVVLALCYGLWVTLSLTNKKSGSSDSRDNTCTAQVRDEG